MNRSNAVRILEGVDSIENAARIDIIIEACQYLRDSGIIDTLPKCYGRLVNNIFHCLHANTEENSNEV